jgi:hypothetical protein
MSKVEAEISRKELEQETSIKIFCFLDKTRICNSYCIAYCKYTSQKCLIIYLLSEIASSLMNLRTYREE